MNTLIYNFLRKFSRLIINIDILFLITILIGLILLLLGKFHSAHLLFVSTLISITLIIFFPLGYYLAVFLENRFQKIEQIPADVIGIIILGTGFDFTVSAERNTPSYLPSIGRLLAFIELTRKYPSLRLVFTGGGRYKNVINESELAKTLFKNAGLDITKIEFEMNARDTNENARFTYEMLKPNKNEKWLLVTSAMHMPRSVGLFRKLSWNIVPYPVDYHTTGKYKIFNVSLLFSLYTWRQSIHELCEMLLNYIFKASDEFITAPRQTDSSSN